MKATLGEHWRNFFDLVCANAKKPLWQRADAPLYEVDMASTTLRGKKISSQEELKAAFP